MVRNNCIAGIVLFPFLFLMIKVGTTLAQSSANFKIIKDVLDTAGATSNSTNYKLEDTAGQPSALGNSTSSGYNLSGGYLAVSAGYVTQVMSLEQGWSWISFNVQPLDPDIEQVMADATNLVIMVNGAGQFYIPNVLNNIGNLDVTQGYKLYFSATEQMTIQGTQVPKSTPVNLTAGWNFVSYLPTMPMNSETALSSIISELVIAKDDAGNFFVPGVINTLGKMMPEKGYKLYIKNATTLIYP